MRRAVVLSAILLLLLSGCSLAGDVTPPPELAGPPAPRTQQADVGTPGSEGTDVPAEAQALRQASSPTFDVPGGGGEGGGSQAARRGTVRGTVSNGTSAGPVPAGMEVTLIGIDSQEVVLKETTTLDESGTFLFEDLQVFPDRIFGVFVEYQGVQYFSEGARLTPSQPDLLLPITVYETTSAQAGIGVDRLHLVFRPYEDERVEVAEIWVVSNRGERTVVPREGGGVLEIPLPPGFAELDFVDDSLVEPRYLVSDHTLVDRMPLRAGEETEVVFSFTLPLQGSLEFRQPMPYPVEATVVMVAEGDLSARARDLQDRGVQEMGGTRWETYTLGALGAGERLNLDLSDGRSWLGAPESLPGVLAGATVLLVVLAAIGVWWRQRQDGFRPEAVTTDRPAAASSDRERLFLALADLDDAFEEGEVAEAEYRRRREDLKARLKALLREADD